MEKVWMETGRTAVTRRQVVMHVVNGLAVCTLVQVDAHTKRGTERTLDGRGKGGGELEASEGGKDRDELHDEWLLVECLLVVVVLIICV